MPLIPQAIEWNRTRKVTACEFLKTILKEVPRFDRIIFRDIRKYNPWVRPGEIVKLKIKK